TIWHLGNGLLEKHVVRRAVVLEYRHVFVLVKRRTFDRTEGPAVRLAKRRLRKLPKAAVKVAGRLTVAIGVIQEETGHAHVVAIEELLCLCDSPQEVRP